MELQKPNSVKVSKITSFLGLITSKYIYIYKQYYTILIYNMKLFTLEYRLGADNLPTMCEDLCLIPSTK